MSLCQLMMGRCWDSTAPLNGWLITPALTPQLGLPPRVAVRMLIDALESDVTHANFHWRIASTAIDALSKGRRHQLTQAPSHPPQPLSASGPLVVVTAGSDSASLHHPAFWGASAERSHILWFLFALLGSEVPLDAIAAAAPGHVTLEECWAWRDAAPMPDAVWCALAKALDGNQTGSQRSQLLDELKRFAPDNEVLKDFCEHIVDVHVGDRSHHVVVRDLNSPPEKPPVPREKEMRVRIAQLAADADWHAMIDRAAAPPFEIDVSTAAATCVREEIQEAFRVRCPSHGETQQKPALIVFPEVTLPHSIHRDRTVPRLVAATGIAALFGSVHRALPPIVRRHGSSGTIFYVNEATLHVPSCPEDEHCPEVRSYTIRKPLPTHVEYAVGEAIENRNGRTQQWRLLHAQALRRFVHPKWGDFAVPICSDVLRPSWWQALQGSVLHLFVPAHNQDVELFDQVSWTRAYDVFANVVLTNHGVYGGSFAWSPKHSHHRELARLRGKSRLAVFADVDLPVAALDKEQRSARRNAIARDQNSLLGVAHEVRDGSGFKAPPAGYRERR